MRKGPVKKVFDSTLQLTLTRDECGAPACLQRHRGRIDSTEQ